MSDRPPADQELVVHVFARPGSAHALRSEERVRVIWSRCRDLLGVTDPITATGLPVDPPAAVGPGPDRALAAAQNGAVDIQVVLRCHQDALNLSLLFAAPSDRGLGARVPPGWIEFDRWWSEVVGQDADALLGTVRVYQATPLSPSIRERLPTRLRGRIRWEEAQPLEPGILLWEPDPSSDPERDFVVMAPVEADARMSAWTWSRGDVAIPPLARYLANAARLRHHVRVWHRDAGWLEQFQAQVDTRVEELGAELGRADAVLGLRGDEAGLAIASDRVRRMRESTDVLRGNMALLLPALLTGDTALAEWFQQELEDALTRLDRSKELAHRVRSIAFDPLPRATVPQAAGKRFRTGFMLDVVDYGGRPTHVEERVQERVAALVKAVVGDLGLDFADADHQSTGDGLLVFLPDHVDVQRALPSLLHGVADRLNWDNTVYQDRLRLRMAADVGPVGLAALGFGGKVALVIGRLLDSAPLRAAFVEHPEADLVVALSDRLHEYVVGEGVPGLGADEFEPVEVVVKTFTGRGWLWRRR